MVIDRRVECSYRHDRMTTVISNLWSAMARNGLLCFAVAWSLCLASSLAAGKEATFTGAWDTLPDKNSAFSLDLVQTGNEIKGYHDSVAQHGNRIDTILPEEGPPSIVGTVKNGVAHVTLKSGYGDGTAEATITLKAGKIEWKIIKSEGVYFVPRKAVLYPGKRKKT